MECKTYFSLDLFSFLYVDKDDANAVLLQSLIETSAAESFDTKSNKKLLKEKNIIKPDLFGGHLLIETKMDKEAILKKIEEKFTELAKEIENGI